VLGGPDARSSGRAVVRSLGCSKSIQIESTGPELNAFPNYRTTGRPIYEQPIYFVNEADAVLVDVPPGPMDITTA
jgi:hypothetical protein